MQAAAQIFHAMLQVRRDILTRYATNFPMLACTQLDTKVVGKQTTL